LIFYGLLISENRGALFSLVISLLYFLPINSRDMAKTIARFKLIVVLICFFVIFIFLNFENYFKRQVSMFQPGFDAFLMMHFSIIVFLFTINFGSSQRIYSPQISSPSESRRSN